MACPSLSKQKESTTVTSSNTAGPRGVDARTRSMPSFALSIHLTRIAGPADSDAVSALLLASYSSLLAARYDSDALSRALPFITSANPTLLASGTYYAAERSPAILSDVEAGRQRGREAAKSLKGKRISVTSQLIPSGWGEELGLPCLLVASVQPGNSAYANYTAIRHSTLNGSIGHPVSRRSGQSM